ncbi:oxidoreductase [Clostridium botulinum]|uniref:Oxidoreductase NAD-binding domain protein n=1 Tax=Clostridium botulinum (strain Eklund 17B / Type B) TaxID=935198 RepID=B2TMB4_CLOBB|nr:FAD-binding oxidoreductase [Clostridium sp. ZBS18]ACD24510.1 oxidoreductase NAD-binding domain protein [Clostridium botulinum B str. Eklund 17B (NRP)]MBN1055492.1 oxidoreductase [Clostridium botulinum]MBY6977007.1 oxidoreductase [Clostridium botulinum]MBY6999164.1 oxidoreductase [Clostridium botulinum]MCR1272754.1 FAD-binding oxidoreductase [Clostridium botulinum]
MIDNKVSSDSRWKGFKDFRVFKIVKEDEVVTSFYLKSLDGSKLPEFIAGQFITVRIKNEDNTFTKPRQYTLSMNYNEEFYRISVKREENGFLSKKLCDEIKAGDNLQITAPLGNFILKNSEKPLVLIGGGIGITPMLTMAYDAVSSDRKIHFIYSIPNSTHHSFKEETAKLNNNNFKSTVLYTRPTETEELGKDFDIKGRISREWMIDNLPKDGEFYFCGPVPFMKTIYHNLISMGIEKEYINFEMFEAGVDITKE